MALASQSMGLHRRLIVGEVVRVDGFVARRHGIAGWFLPYGQPILLVDEGGTFPAYDHPQETVRTLVRLGYDQIAGYLSGGMHAWHTAGNESHAIGMVTVEELCRRTFAPGGGEEPWILDVRSQGDLETVGRIDGAHHIHLTQMPGALGRVPTDRTIYIFCGSGRRSVVAASILRRAGWERLVVVLGGMLGWNSVKCEIGL
jgi:hydroxyacylglutathione hydrolase